jgi:hypothetical protein
MAKEINDKPQQQPEEEEEQSYRPPAHHLGKTVCGDVLANRLAQQQLHQQHEHHQDNSCPSPCASACSLVSGSMENVGGKIDDDDEVVILNHSKKGIIAITSKETDAVDDDGDDDSNGPSRSILEVRYVTHQGRHPFAQNSSSQRVHSLTRNGDFLFMHSMIFTGHAFSTIGRASRHCSSLILSLRVPFEL